MRLKNKYLAVKNLHEEKSYPINVLCGILSPNRSSYCKWLRRDPSEQEVRDTELIDRICTLYQESNGIFGYRRMQLNLLRRFGLHCNHKRIYRVIRGAGLKSVIRRKGPNYIKSTLETTVENLLNRNFTAENLNEKWLTDVTAFKYGNGGKMYLRAIFDLKDKSIVSYVIGHHNDNQLAFDTFEAAIQKYPDAKPLFHSDRGYQYTSKVFKAKLDAGGMTRFGRRIDNGPMETFWGTLKAEMYDLRRFLDYDNLRDAIERYIHFYNNGRYQAGLDGFAPFFVEISGMNS